MSEQDALTTELASKPHLRRTYQRIAPVYDLLDLAFERRRYQALRPRLFEGLSGVLLDAGIGTGRNIPVYPKASRVFGIDLSPAMLARAERRARRLGRVVELRETDVCRTDFPDDSFDGIVSSFLFCVLGPDQQLPALRELARICKPGGTIRILEYSLSANPLRRLVMGLWAPWVRWAYGAAFDRNTEDYVPRSGLEVVETTFLYRDIIKLIVARPLEPQGD